MAEETVVVARNSAPSVVFPLGQYICQKVNITVKVFNRLNNTISKIIAPPARKFTMALDPSLYRASKCTHACTGPTVFQQNMTAYPFMVDGKIKELEISFTVSLVHATHYAVCIYYTLYDVYAHSLQDCVTSKAVVM